MYGKAVEILCPSGSYTGGAWLSSARVVRCWVKSRNERNPYSVLPADNAGDSQKTAGVNSEEGYTPPVTPRKSATPEAGGLTVRKEPSKVGSVIGVKS